MLLLLFNFLLFFSPIFAFQQLLSLAPQDTLIEKKHGERWRQHAIDLLWEERDRFEFTTPLFKIDKIPNATIYFKNETASPTESLKHRYSWALVLWALLQGFIHRETEVFEASSGNTARSEAYMLRLLNVSFTTVLPDFTEPAKIEKIKAEGGKIVLIRPDESIEGFSLGKARSLAENTPNGFFINQFGNSEKAMDFHESGNLTKKSMNMFHEILSELREQNQPDPTHFIMSAATGTISSVGRYIKKYGVETEIVLADTEFSPYYDLVTSGRFADGTEDPKPLWVPPGMEGTGFGWAGRIRQNTSSLMPSVLDRALKLPDLASTAAMHLLREHFGINGGPSTGVNFAAALKLVGQAREVGDPSRLSIVTLLADPGKNYDETYYNVTWINEKFAKHGGKTIFDCWKSTLKQFLGLTDDGHIELANWDPIVRGSKQCARPAGEERKTD